MAQEITVGGGQYIPKSGTGYQTIPTGSSGVLLDLSDPSGKDVRLDFLVSSQSGDPFGEANIEVEVDGVSFITGALAGGSTSSVGAGGFAIQQTAGYPGSENTSSAISQSVGNISDVIGKNIVVRKTSGTIVSPIAYSSTAGK